jgi:phage-related tail protein
MLENEFDSAVQTAKKKAAEIQRTFASALSHSGYNSDSYDEFGNYTDKWGDKYNQYDYKDRKDDDNYERKKYKSDLDDKAIDDMQEERVEEDKFIEENPEVAKEIREKYKKETGHEPTKDVMYDIAQNGGINDRKRDDWKKKADEISKKADNGDYDKDIKEREEKAKDAWARNEEERKKNEEKRKNGGYAKGTDNATRGWHLVGEEGPEIRWFEGGETVLDTATSMNLIDKLTNIGNMEFLVKVSSTLDIDYEKLANAIGSKLKPSINVENTFNSPKALDEKTIKRQETMLMRDLAIKFR